MLAERLRVAQASIMPVWFGQSMRALYPCTIRAGTPPVILLMTGRWPELAEVRFRMLLTCLACLVIRTAFPALGSAGQALPGFVASAHGLTDAMPQLGPLLATEMPTTFPVSHVAGAVTMVVIAWRFWGRRVAVGFSTLAFAIVLATFFVQGLLVLEPIMSLLLVLILQYAVAPLLLGSRPRLQRWFGRLGAGRRVDAEGRRFHRGVRSAVTLGKSVGATVNRHHPDSVLPHVVPCPPCGAGKRDPDLGLVRTTQAPACGNQDRAGQHLVALRSPYRPSRRGIRRTPCPCARSHPKVEARRCGRSFRYPSHNRGFMRNRGLAFFRKMVAKASEAAGDQQGRVSHAHQHRHHRREQSGLWG